MERTRARISLGILKGLLALAFVGAGAKLVWIQVLHPLEPEALADTTQRTVRRHGRRGMILDAHRVKLALSQQICTLRADPAVIGTNTVEFANAIAPLLGKPVEELLPLLSLERNIRLIPRGYITNAADQVSTLFVPWTNRSVAVQSGVLPQDWETIRAGLRGLWKSAESNEVERLRRTLPRRQRGNAVAQYQRRLQQLRLLGVVADGEEQRCFPHDGLAAHVLGFVTNLLDSAGRPVDELAGVMGIELQFNEQLRGREGLLQTHVTRKGELVAARELDLGALDGMNVVLAIDVGIQSIVERALAGAGERLRPKSLTAVVTRPHTGEILALAVSPAFSPARLNAHAQTVNHATRMQFDPGSAFKIFTYAAVLNEGLATTDERIDTEHGYWARYKVRDDHRKSGAFSPEESFAESFNTVAAKLTTRLPELVLVGYLTNFGFGSSTGLPLGREERGIVLHPSSRGQVGGWDGYTQSRIAYGYSVSVTPIQMAMALGMIANGGTLMEPLLVKRIETPDGVVLREFGPRKRRENLLKPETIQLVHQFMRTAVSRGTGKKAALEDWTVAGKTGTAHKLIPHRGYMDDLYYGSFAGFLPAEDPQLAIYVVVDEPKIENKAYYGGAAAAPIFAEIARGAAIYLALKPSPKPGTNDVNSVETNALSLRPTLTARTTQ